MLFKKQVIRVIPLLLMSCVCVYAARAQVSHSRKKENFDVHRFHVESIDIPVPSGTLALKNMRGITVIDARADTAAIGFMQKKLVDPLIGALNNASLNQAEQRVNKTPTFLKLDNGCRNDAEQFANKYLVFPKDNPLPGILMVIKKLWLSDELNLRSDAHGSGRFEGTDSRDVWTSGVDIKIEFYLKDKFNFYPLYRYDSVISEAMTVSEYASQFIAQALQLSLQKMVQMDNKIEAVKTRKNFSMEEIQLHNQNEFDIPALTDTVLKKGVYMTFEEFKTNQPSQTDFEIKKDKLTDIIYIKQPGGGEYAARDTWGYSDGENAFVKSANNFFLLQRAANAFYIFGAKSIRRTEYSSSGTGGYYSGGGTVASPYYVTNTKTAIQLEPFQLDWSTGKLY